MKRDTNNEKDTYLCRRPSGACDATDLGGRSSIVERPSSSGDNVGAIILGLFIAYVVGTTIGKGGTTMSTKGTDAAFEKPKGKLLKKF